MNTFGCGKIVVRATSIDESLAIIKCLDKLNSIEKLILFLIFIIFKLFVYQNIIAIRTTLSCILITCDILY